MKDEDLSNYQYVCPTNGFIAQYYKEVSLRGGVSMKKSRRIDTEARMIGNSHGSIFRHFLKYGSLEKYKGRFTREVGAKLEILLKGLEQVDKRK